MKKKICIILAIFTMVFLSACEPTEYSFNYNDLKTNVVSVELLDYDIDETKMVRKKSDILPFDSEKATVIERLADEEVDGFFKNLSEHVFLEIEQCRNSPKGYCLRLNYNNNDFLILNFYKQEHNVLYGNDNSVKRVIGQHAWSGLFADLVNSHFDTQIE